MILSGGLVGEILRVRANQMVFLGDASSKVSPLQCSTYSQSSSGVLGPVLHRLARQATVYLRVNVSFGTEYQEVLVLVAMGRVAFVSLDQPRINIK